MKRAWFFSLLWSASVFCAPHPKQPLPAYIAQGEALKEADLPPAYCAPARPAFARGWNFFLMGSFLYWMPEQEGMEIAVPTTVVSGDSDLSFSTAYGASYIRSHFSFSQGFRAGLGFSCDLEDFWMGALEYTHFHQKMGTPSFSVSSSHADTYLALTNWFLAARPSVAVLPASKVGSKWKLDIDMGDAYFGRPCYQGRCVVMTPFVGVRGLWLRQNFRVHATIPELAGIFVVQPITSHNYLHSWAVGPRIGLLGRWLLGWGFRVEGDAAGALLYTRYTKVSHRESETAYLVPFHITLEDAYHFTFKNYSTVRPMANIGVGFGWGGYLGWCRDPSAFLDISVTYDFLQFWGQNMMEKLVNDYHSGMNNPACDLHIQGVTANLRLDF